MTNRSKDKGTAAESAVVTYLQSRGWHYAERRALHGDQDKGDVAGIYGVAGAVVVEVKACKTQAVPAWLREAKAEQAHAGAALGVVISKPIGVGHGSVGDWHAHLTVQQLCDLLEQAGYR